MRGKRPNGKNLPWRRRSEAVPPEVSNGIPVYHRSAVGATAPPLDQTAVAEFGRAGRRPATGTHPDPAPSRLVSGLCDLHRQLLSAPGTVAFHRCRRFLAPAERLGAPGPAPLCPRAGPHAAADGLDLASRPLPLLVGDAAGRWPGGTPGLLPRPGRTGGQRSAAGVRGPGAHPTAALAAAPPPVHPDRRPRFWQPGPAGLPPAPGLRGPSADQRRHADPTRRGVASAVDPAPAGGGPAAVVPGAAGEAECPAPRHGERRRRPPAAA